MSDKRLDKLLARKLLARKQRLDWFLNSPYGIKVAIFAAIKTADTGDLEATRDRLHAIVPIVDRIIAGNKQKQSRTVMARSVLAKHRPDIGALVRRAARQHWRKHPEKKGQPWATAVSILPTVKAQLGKPIGAHTVWRALGEKKSLQE